MKKILFAVLIVAFLVSLISCSGNGANQSISSIISSSSTDASVDTGLSSTGSSTVSNGDNDNSLENKKDPFEIVTGQEAAKGWLSGKIALNIEPCEYELYFGNENGKLENYSKIGSYFGNFDLNGVVVPPQATHIVLDTGKETYTQKIPEECLLFNMDATVFGVLSDVHFNRYNIGGEDPAIVSFDRALDYFGEIDVDFVGICGDISDSGKESAFEKYNDAIKDRPFPVYTVTGNHDVSAIESGLWKEYISDNIEDCAFAENGLDFVLAPQSLGGDVVVFLNQVRWEYNTGKSTILDQEQLDWLENVLIENKDRRVYLFFHTFMRGPDGKVHTGVGNVQNSVGHKYKLPYTYGTKDEVVFRRLMKEYKNVVYFSGHSHWMFEAEKYGEWANYSNFDGEYCHMFHVPSVTEPRWMEDTDTFTTSKTLEYSQGTIVYDYGEFSVFVPIDFISGALYTEYMEIVYE